MKTIQNRLYIILLISLFLIFASCNDSGKKEISGSGSVEVDDVSISPMIPGRILKFHIEEGDRVHKGDILISLSEDEVRAGVAMSEAGIEAAQKNVIRTQSAYENARKELSRARELYDAGAISTRDFDKANMGFDITKSAYEAARAQVRQLRAGLELATSRKNEAILTSPIDGKVMRVNFREGEVVLPGATLLTVGNLETVILRIFVPIDRIPLIHTGNHAEVTAPGIETPLSGKVIYISERAEFTPRNVQTEDARARLVFAVKINVDNPDELLKPGMPADAIIQVESENKIDNSGISNETH